MEIDPNLHSSPSPEKKGQAIDMDFISDESWIQDSEVISQIKEKRGRWHVNMLFFSIYSPMRMLVRQIDHYHSKKKAETFANIFLRGIRKDPRGTLKRKDYGYHICAN
ncbi:MAG: hypothetical protein AAFY71_16960 [Bacteroidota bacterium]